MKRLIIYFYYMKSTTTNNKTILVIEDDTALLAAIKVKLEHSGFDVVISRSVEHAFTTEYSDMLDTNQEINKSYIETSLAHLQTLEKVDAIWLDHNLIGKEDGLDFVVKFKANGGSWASLPIFVVSNSANDELIKTYAELGVTKYYLKAEHTLVAIIRDIKDTLGVYDYDNRIPTRK